ncbi:MAG TPA: AraC family transcriptional regulator [Thermoanaerobaculia bacterium]|nr:AraC family transcriptional regulator [Thermoanaerobaculia bacterium]
MSDFSESTAGERLPGINTSWLFKSPRLGITLWDCSAGRRELSEERHQAWHVVSFVHSGAFVLHARSRPAVIDATSVLFHNPGEPFRSEHPFGCHDHGSSIVILRELLLDLLGPDARFPKILLHGLFGAHLLQRLLVRSLREGKPREAMAVEEAVLKVLREVLKGDAQDRASSTSPRERSRARRSYAEDAKALLQQRFRERLQLDDIARSLYVSPYHLCRLFREETGVPIHSYLNRLRLREALEPIAEGEADLSRLAAGLGFSSHSHFTAAFRKEFGMSPRGVKKLAAARVSEMVRSLEL